MARFGAEVAPTVGRGPAQAAGATGGGVVALNFRDNSRGGVGYTVPHCGV